MQAVGPDCIPSGQYAAIVNIPRLIAASVNWRSAAAIATWLGSNAPDYVAAAAASGNLWDARRIAWLITGVTTAERYVLCYGPTTSGPWTVVGGGHGRGGGADSPTEASLVN